MNLFMMVKLNGIGKKRIKFLIQLIIFYVKMIFILGDINFLMCRVFLDYLGIF